MATELLETKFNIPPLGPEFVPRPRLIERLNRGLVKQMILLSAPAGFGKTTLLANWASQCQAPMAWLSLDRDDNDLSRFMVYLIGAFERMAWPTAEKSPSWDAIRLQPPDQALIALINALAQIQTNLLLVLDDYHLIELEAIDSAVTYLLAHQPPILHLVIATRADPSLPFARLRARGQLIEIREADLRFTDSEAGAFLHGSSGHDLSVADVMTLQSRTEGWIAGLQLASLALQQHQDIHQFIATFAGEHEYIADYLQDEVLRWQPAELQRFLLQTSILDRLCGPLCDAVTGGTDSQQWLEQIKNMNLFLLSLDSERHWYRYHSLFADLLQQDLRRKYPDELPRLHRRASQWYATNNLPAKAIEHALAAGDLERAADLIAAIGETMLMRSENTTLANWIEALPTELVAARTDLRTYYAAVSLLLGKPLDLVESWLPAIDPAAGDYPAVSLPLYAYLAILQGRESRAAELAQQALARIPEEERFLRSLAVYLLNIASLRDTGPERGIQQLEETERIVRETGNLTITVMTLSNQAELYLTQGKLKEAETSYRRALAQATDLKGGRLPIAGIPLIGLGELAREWNDLTRAEQFLQEGIVLARQWAEPAVLDGIISLSLVRRALGDSDEVVRLLDEARQIAARFDASDLDDWLVGYISTRIWLLLGRVDRVWEWIRNQGLMVEISAYPLEKDQSWAERKRKYERMILARLLLAEDRTAEALVLLEGVQPLLARRERIRSLIEVLNLTALAYQAQGDLVRALATLAEALRLAEPGKHVRIFLDEGPPMIRLLYQAARREISPTYVGQLLVAATTDKHIPAQTGQAELISSLTTREQEVLTLIAEGLTNQQIATTLVLSLSTVKVHTRNIYGKLNVNSRTQAVAQARMLGII